MDALREAVESRIREAGGRQPLADRLSGVSLGDLRSVQAGREAKSSTIQSICDAFGLEFYIGPPRRADAERAPLPPDSETHHWGNRRGAILTPFPVQMREGHQPERVGFSPNGCASFGLEFLLEFDLNPLACEVIEIYDDSMAPEFPAGAAGLVDLRRTRRADGRVFVLEAPGLTVRRTVKTRTGWVAAADNREYESARWSHGFRVVGQVVWTSHMVGVSKLAQRPGA